MAIDLLPHLKALCAVPGLPGYEKPVRELLRAAWGPLATAIHEDKLGNLIAERQGIGAAPRPRVMLAAHMDAIGMMVSRIDGEFMRVMSNGGIDARVLPGQLVTIHGREDLPGVAAQPPAFLLPKNRRENVIPLAELVIDAGLPAARLAELVRVGDLVSFAEPPHELLNEQFAAHRLDNRASLAAVTVCLDTLQGRVTAWDVLAAATVQEEVGLRGAATAAFAMQPDLAVAIDVTFGSDANTREFSHRTHALGGGPVLALGPNIHSGLHAAFKKAAERAEIPYGIEATWGNSGTDAAALQLARSGIPTMVVSIPLRNMHTPVEVVSLKDIARAGRLLAEWIAGLEAGFMQTLVLD
jgi:putative aminopeptidase FrvX